MDDRCENGENGENGEISDRSLTMLAIRNPKERGERAGGVLGEFDVGQDDTNII